MRLIIHEMAFEKRLSAGMFRYEQGGQRTGATEQWRLTQVADGYRCLRVDLDGRASSGHTYLFHVVLANSGQLERVTFRFWRTGQQVAGNVLLQPDTLTLNRDLNGETWQEVLDAPSLFLFPATMGLFLLWQQIKDITVEKDEVKMPAVMLCPEYANPPFSLWKTQITVQRGQKEELAVRQQPIVVQPYLIRWLDQTRILWLDEQDRLHKMTRQDGLTATETRAI